MSQREIEELLEAIWVAEEEDEKARLEFLITDEADEPLPTSAGAGAVLQEAKSSNLVEQEGNIVTLTQQGRVRSQNIVRRHRLAERLLNDILDLESREVESTACRFEHLLSEEAANSVCILLGHPTTCPHGKPIPEGECCQQHLTDIRPLVIPASRLRPGESGRVAYVGTRDRRRLERLANLGILPGMEIHLHQRQPSYVVKIDETQWGLDSSLMAEIYVRRMS
jgi:DtxR family Mn-dependent transcriptional regulator